ncbi:MAG: hypothetical protein JXA67_07150, partial [Micromonosporaceae bacterium]|nr:hypothetical protein [Micromonosporaceae bacterium]
MLRRRSVTGTRAGEATRPRPAWAGPLVLAVTACLLGPLLAAGCATRQRADWTAGVPSEQIGQSGAPLSPGTPIAVLAPPAGDALVTNEYATYSSDSAAAVSPDWTANSGSLFARDGAFWSGVPDSCQPDQQSSRCTNSNVFRMNSRRAFGGSITVGIAVRQNRNLANPRCEAAHTCWHG